MRSWVFRNRRRLEALLGRPSPPFRPERPEPAPPRTAEPVPAHAERAAVSARRVVVLQPAPRSR